MGIELIVLYSIYAIVGGVAGVSVVNVVENITVTAIKANAEKYVACSANKRNNAYMCKELE